MVASILSIAGLLWRGVQALKMGVMMLERIVEILERGTPALYEYLEQLSPYLNAMWGAYENLPETAQNVVTLTAIFSSLLTFVFTAPMIARAILGADPILDAVPFPAVKFDAEYDDQADQFRDPDVQPQLAPESGDDTIACVQPHSGITLGHAPIDTPETVRIKTDAARLAQRAWARTTYEQRRSVLRTLRNYLLEHQTHICGMSRMDTGKTMLDASLGEIVTTLEKIRWLVAEGEYALRPSRRSTGPMSKHKVAEVIFEPLGVIGAIAPWNYPIHNFFNPVLAALFSGNAVVVKPSEHTVFSSLYISRIIRRVLTLCGHDPELVQIAVGGADIGAAMVNDAGLDKLFFTGSTKVGRLVSAAAAEKLLPVVLELGGKDPFIITASANLPHALSLCMRGVFQNAGQNCIGVERVFVHESQKDEFVRTALEQVKQLRLGVDVGAMTMGETAVKSVVDLVADAKKDGAKLLHGGKAAVVDGRGSFLEPTLLVDVKPTMRIANEEVFGPVMTVFSWSTVDELLKMVNGCAFGLGANVFSNSSKEARQIVSGLRVGMANVNDFGINYLCQSMPFGGCKESGSDRFAGIEGLRGCCLMKSTTRDRFPLIKTVLPRNLKYPVTGNSYSLALEINKLMYLPGFINKIDSCRAVLISLIWKEYIPRTTKADMDMYE